MLGISPHRTHILLNDKEDLTRPFTSELPESIILAFKHKFFKSSEI